jgi:hypothetical protein
MPDEQKKGSFFQISFQREFCLKMKVSVNNLKKKVVKKIDKARKYVYYQYHKH